MMAQLKIRTLPRWSVAICGAREKILGVSYKLYSFKNTIVIE
jgi:hypothetical protein